MKRARKAIFFIVAILIFAFTFASMSGVYSYRGDTKTTYVKGIGDIRWGIDINGGVEATFAPDTGDAATTEQMDAARSVIETRLVQNNITDYELDVDYNHNRIIVRYPWSNDEQDFDPEEAIQELAATSELTFREGSEYQNTSLDSNGETVYTDPTGVTAENVLLEGSDVDSASAGVIQNQTTGESQYVVNLKLTEDGAEKFAEATKKVANAGTTLSIWMDNTMISSASVDQAEYGETGITGGNAQISGNFTAQEATQLANQINFGALPF